MKFLIDTFKSFTKFEICLWLGSYFVIVVSFIFTSNKDYFNLAASLVGATALIFVAKGNVIGQFLTVIFCVFYGIISFSYQYYGEMITYVGMSMPIAIASIVTWLRNPFEGNKSEVKVAHLKLREYLLMFLLGAFVTIAFYFILKVFNTNNLITSTLSVLTSFIAAYLTMRRSEYYALAYAFNDIVLIFLWILATMSNLSYLPLVLCFVVFLANDIYGFIHWSKTKKRQNLFS
ncbi:MAG TPA: nicotinamide riboside transporter PnuC [Clostridia bacterium]|nr:nicotinamide riboside transporter PnuC [Clostridia bacterium]